MGIGGKHGGVAGHSDSMVDPYILKQDPHDMGDKKV
jgi:hypothetical protein